MTAPPYSNNVKINVLLKKRLVLSHLAKLMIEVRFQSRLSDPTAKLILKCCLHSQVT